MNSKRQTSAQRGYGYAWQKYREGYLRSHPQCVICWNIFKRIRLATIVDHIEPHQGDQKKFWDKSNHQAVCKWCHDSYKKRLERSGRVAGCDEDGMPLDPNHTWNKK